MMQKDIPAEVAHASEMDGAPLQQMQITVDQEVVRHSHTSSTTVLCCDPRIK